VRTAHRKAELRIALEPLRGATIGLVPTMGALHKGHLALIRRARSECETVCVSIFVNPAQFDQPSDLERYPRDQEHDLWLCQEEGIDLVFAPSAEEMYPPGFETWVEVAGASRGLEGDFRPGHFRAVATVCLKLFEIVRPDCAYFGAKDAQQLAVIRQLVRDLDLALSSRNARLSDAEREVALTLPHALQVGVEAARAGGDPVAAAGAALADQRGLSVEYVSVANFDGSRLLAAVHVGSTRLIDNLPLEGADS
jgi:pantoate--beta-alanine ligase